MSNIVNKAEQMRAEVMRITEMWSGLDDTADYGIVAMYRAFWGETLLLLAASEV